MANKCHTVTPRGRNREPLLAVVELIILDDTIYPKALSRNGSYRHPPLLVCDPVHLSIHPSIQFRHRDAEESETAGFLGVCEDNSCTVVEILRSFIWGTEGTQPLRKSWLDRSDNRASLRWSILRCVVCKSTCLCSWNYARGKSGTFYVTRPYVISEGWAFLCFRKKSYRLGLYRDCIVEELQRGKLRKNIYINESWKRNN